ncbi:MAG: hypothetical protein ACSHWY_03330 [Octadecabacter sp.]
MTRLLKSLMTFMLLTGLTACIDTISSPIFEEGRLTVAELEEISGRFRGLEREILTVTRASTTTDLLNWSFTLGDENFEFLRGQAVLSKVPESDLYLAVLFNVVAEGEVAFPIGIAFLHRTQADSFRLLKIEETGFFARTMRRFTDPDQQAQYILDFVLSSRSELSEQTDGYLYVQIPTTPTYSPTPVAPAAPDNSQCMSRVESRLLYCREESSLNSGGIVYVVDCTSGSRSEKRECRGWFSEDTFSSGIDPYYCDPQTDVKGPSPESVAQQVCR